MTSKTLVLVCGTLAAAQGALLERVNALDLSHVERALVERDGLTAEAAAEAVHLYRAWRFLGAAHPERTVLLPEIADKAWHWDILHTESYEAGCAAVEGYFLHHRPGVAPAVIEAEWPGTMALFRDALGIDLPASLAYVGNCVGDTANCVRKPANQPVAQASRAA